MGRVGSHDHAGSCKAAEVEKACERRLAMGSSLFEICSWSMELIESGLSVIDEASSIDRVHGRNMRVGARQAVSRTCWERGCRVRFMSLDRHVVERVVNIDTCVWRGRPPMSHE